MFPAYSVKARNLSLILGTRVLKLETRVFKLATPVLILETRYSIEHNTLEQHTVNKITIVQLTGDNT